MLCSKSRLAGGVIALLYLVGLGYWSWFANFGVVEFAAFDWFKEYAYYGVIGDALRRGAVPWHIGQSFQNTTRFMVLPETVLSPQIVLLRWAQAGTFVWLNTLLMYSVGFWGCVRLAARHRLGSAVFALMATAGRDHRARRRQTARPRFFAMRASGGSVFGVKGSPVIRSKASM